MTPGTQLGSYEILSPLGKGGMGEVWRARDQKLGREVAIKTLPEEFAQDEERLARFEREAKLLASLNHPNIATIHGLEEHDGMRFLVLELVEGDTLADRLKRGAIPVEESLKFALQIAEALEAAHEKGVIHRDLKPANIKVTPDGKVKVLDFGLAKAFAGDGSEPNLSQSPTLSLAATQQGVILGTAAYMSPEQARGVTVDKRADIWALGCVLYEMLTGKQVFQGELMSDVMASVLKSEPDYKGLPPTIHPKLRELLRRCLEKEPKQRWHDIGDVRVELEQVLADPSGTLIQPAGYLGQVPARTSLVWIAASVLVSVVVGGIAVWNLKPSDPRSAWRFTHNLPKDQTFTSRGRPVVASSPDGTKFVYLANNQLYVRSMNDLTAVPIQGTEDNISSPFFSRDGQWIGYWSRVDGQLKKIPVTGGTPIPLCDAANPFGASWGEDDNIVFGQDVGIMRVSASGQEPELLIATEDGEQAHGPQILPDGSVLFTLTKGSEDTRWNDAQIVVQSLETDVRKTVFEGGSDARYVPTGHLVYAWENILFGAGFDVANLELVGAAVPIVEDLRRADDPSGNTASANYGFSVDGTLVYAVGGLDAADLKRLILMDRDGTVENLPGPPKDYSRPRFSPNGNQIAVESEESGEDSIWVYPLAGDTSIRRLTLEGNNRYPEWTPDGERITFESDRAEQPNIFWKRADGTGVAEPLTDREGGQVPESWSPDGQHLTFREQRDIWVRTGDATPEPFAVMESTQTASKFSPDGKWVAYSSNHDQDIFKVYVEPFPKTGTQYQITSKPTGPPVWSPDGRELVYADPTHTLWSVPISTEPSFSFGNAAPLPQPPAGTLLFVSGVERNYDISPDGEQFLFASPVQSESRETPSLQINIVLNWFEELKERVPVP